MKRLVRAGFVIAVASAPLLGTHPAFAADPGTLFTCPPTLGGLPLVGQDAKASQVDPWFGEHGASFFCEYQRDDDPTLGDMHLSAGVIWEENAVSPEEFYCAGDGRLLDDVGSNGEMIATLSIDRRAVSLANESTTYGGSHAISIQPAVDLAAEMLPLAEARAAVCPGVSDAGGSTAGGTSDGGVGETGDTGTDAEPADPGGSGGPGVSLLVGGLVAAVSGGVGSVLLGKGGSGGVQVAPPADKLFSGQEALDMLHTAGLIEPVLDAAGRPVGYRPLGDLQQMLDSATPWQPSFANPVSTPDGGTATHLSGVAFQPGPDGTISSITIAVRPGGAVTSNGAPAPQTSSGPDQPPGMSLGDQLWVAGMEAVAKGIPIEAVLDTPDRPPGPSLADSVYVDSIESTPEYLDVDGPISAVSHMAPPAPPPPTPTAPPSAPTPPAAPAPPPAPTPPTAAVPPADPARFDQWLTTPGDKTITAEDLHALLPDHVGESGKVKGGLYAGGRVSATIGDGAVNVTVRAPDSTDSLLDIALPDIEINGTLSTNAGRLVVGIQGHDANSIIGKAVQEQLDGLNAKLSGAGMGIDKIQIVKGAIKMEVVPAH